MARRRAWREYLTVELARAVRGDGVEVALEDSATDCGDGAGAFRVAIGGIGQLIGDSRELVRPHLEVELESVGHRPEAEGLLRILLVAGQQGRALRQAERVFVPMEDNCQFVYFFYIS